MAPPFPCVSWIVLKENPDKKIYISESFSLAKPCVITENQNIFKKNLTIVIPFVRKNDKKWWYYKMSFSWNMYIQRATYKNIAWIGKIFCCFSEFKVVWRAFYDERNTKVEHRIIWM